MNIQEMQDSIGECIAILKRLSEECTANAADLEAAKNDRESRAAKAERGELMEKP